MRVPRSLFLLVALIALHAVAARAQSAQAHLAWNDARARGGLAALTYDCAADTGASEFVVTLVPATDLLGVTDVVVTLQVYPVPWAACEGPPCIIPPVPAWWEFHPGGTRAGRFSANAAFPAAPSGGPVAVRDPWAGAVSVNATAALQLVSYARVSWLAELLSIEVAPTGRAPVDLRAGQEYYLARGIVSHGRATGGPGEADCCAPTAVGLRAVAVREGETPAVYFEGSDAPIGWNTGHVKCAVARLKTSVWSAPVAPRR